MSDLQDSQKKKNPAPSVVPPPSAVEARTSSWADDVPAEQPKALTPAWGKDPKRWEAVAKPPTQPLVQPQPREQPKQQAPREQPKQAQQAPREQPKQTQQAPREPRQTQQPPREQAPREQAPREQPRERSREQAQEQAPREGTSGDGEPRDRAPRDTFERRGFQIDRNVPPHRTDFPAEGPFKAYIGNVPFTANHALISSLFEGLQITHIKLLKDQETGNLKGFGYVEFETLEDLKTALEMNGAVIQNRAIRVDLPETRDKSERQPGERQPGERQPAEREQQRDRGKKSDGIDDWRVRDESTRPAPPEHNRERQNRTPRDGQQADRAPREAQAERREGQRTHQQRPPQPDFEPERILDGKERPKLNLLPRGQKPSSTQTPAEAAEAKRSKPDPFGGAKPRDELEIQKKLEERKKEGSS